MRRRDALPENDRRLAVPGAALLTAARSVSRRSRLLAVVVGAASILAVGCGEDGNDAPGGSAPPASTPGSASPVGPGPGSPDTGPSPESADEAHPSVPVGTPADTDG